MRNIVLAFLLVFTLNINGYSAPTNQSNADIYNSDMSDITGWDDIDTLAGDSSQVTFDSKSCMKMFSGATVGIASRREGVGTIGTRVVVSMNIYCDSIGTFDERFLFILGYNPSRFGVLFQSDGLFIYDGASINELGTNLVVLDSWQEWTFDINFLTQKVDVYLGGILQGANIDCCIDTGGGNGLTYFSQYGSNAIPNNLTYIDWLKVGSNFASQAYGFIL
jgi:hypothetical protein